MEAGGRGGEGQDLLFVGWSGEVSLKMRNLRELGSSGGMGDGEGRRWQSAGGTCFEQWEWKSLSFHCASAFSSSKCGYGLPQCSFSLWVPIYPLSIVVKTNRTENSIETILAL